MFLSSYGGSINCLHKSTLNKTYRACKYYKPESSNLSPVPKCPRTLFMLLPKINTKTDYRAFILEYISLNEISRADFCTKFHAYCNYGSLGPVLSKSPDGSFRDTRGINNVKLAALLKAMGVERNDITKIIVHKMTFESDILPVKHGSEFKKIMSELTENTSSSSKSDTFSSIIDLLDPRAKKKVTEMLIEEIKYNNSSRSKINDTNRNTILNELRRIYA